MSDRYDQPFYIPVGHRLRERWGSQLPSLEPPSIDTFEAPVKRPIPMSEKDKAGHRRGEMLYLLGKVQELEKRLTEVENRTSRKRKHGIY